MRRFIYLSFFILIQSLFSKSTFSQPGNDNIEKELIGKWRWTDNYWTSEGFSDITDSPQKCKCTKELIFYKKGLVEEYRNDTLINTSEYSIIYLLNDPVEYVIKSSIISGSLMIEGNKLSIGALGMCGQIKNFKRKIDKL